MLARFDAAEWPDREWPPLCRLHIRSDGKFLGYGRDVKAVAEQRLAEEGFYGVTFGISFEGRYERQIDGKVPWPAEIKPANLPVSVTADAAAETST